MLFFFIHIHLGRLSKKSRIEQEKQLEQEKKKRILEQQKERKRKQREREKIHAQQKKECEIKFNFASEEEFIEATKDFDKLNEQLKFSNCTCCRKVRLDMKLDHQLF